MASFSAGTTFTDGVANDVTAAKLAALVNAATPTSGLIKDRTEETSIASNDTLLFGDASASDDLKRITVANFAGTLPTATITSGTITTLNSTTGTITTGVIPTLTSTTLITTGTGTAASPAIVPTGDTNTGIFFPAADTIAFSEGETEAMRIDSSGNVGIGTSSPTHILDVNGVVACTANSNGSLPTATSGLAIAQNYGGGAAGSAEVDFIFNSATFAGANGGFRFYQRTGASTAQEMLRLTQNTVIAYTGGTERMRIDSSGNVMIGTTNTDPTLGVGIKFAASATIPFVSTVVDTVGANNYILYNLNATDNGYRFYVNSNGGIYNFSANNVNLSDERLKTNINPSGNYLDKICSIPVKTFNYKDQGEDTEKTIGVLAQEVEAHIPELINNDGFGETPADGIPLKTIYQTDLQYVLMRCIQELKSENDSLKSRIEALESK